MHSRDKKMHVVYHNLNYHQMLCATQLVYNVLFVYTECLLLLPHKQ